MDWETEKERDTSKKSKRWKSRNMRNRAGIGGLEGRGLILTGRRRRRGKEEREKEEERRRRIEWGRRRRC